jgi:hypothetical protein
MLCLPIGLQLPEIGLAVANPEAGSVTPRCSFQHMKQTGLVV